MTAQGSGFRHKKSLNALRLELTITVEETKCEVEPEGYRLDSVLEDIPRQQILIFSKLREPLNLWVVTARRSGFRHNRIIRWWSGARDAG